MTLDRYLKLTRTSANDFAWRLGVSSQAVSRYVAGRVPRPEVMQRIYWLTEGAVTPNDFFELRQQKRVE